MTAPIGLFYGSSTCYTEIAAEKICAELGADLVDIHNIAASGVAPMENYQLLILGIPTWDYGELQEDWEALWDAIDQLDFNGKTIALYGLGDQIGYPEWFQDALGFLWAKVVNLGGKVVGQWPVTGYSFEQSKALTADGNYFVGLALDDENDFELSDERIARWCQQIVAEFGLAPPNAGANTP
ncbi:MAG: flavodoxin FldB [Porticoccaceae bacterium]|nr:flavodoxin FldB [Porticoccaceae bacterium]